jgi:hypothetical protein
MIMDHSISGQTAPMVSEYDYVSGPVLLRVSKELTAAQAGEYQAVLNAH